MEKGKKNIRITVPKAKNNHKRNGVTVNAKRLIEAHVMPFNISSVNYTSTLHVNVTEGLVKKMAEAKLKELKKRHKARVPIKYPPGASLEINKADVVPSGNKARKKKHEKGNRK